MRITSRDGKVENPEVLADYDSAERFGKVRVGRTGVFYPENLGMKYIPYEKLERVFKRINEVNGKLCCGNATFYYYRIVFVSGGKEAGDWLTEEEKLVDAAIAAVAENSPATRVGYVKE